MTSEPLRMNAFADKPSGITALHSTTGLHEDSDGISVDETLVLPLHKRMVVQYAASEAGVTELRLFYGSKEISFDEPELRCALSALGMPLADIRLRGTGSNASEKIQDSNNTATTQDRHKWQSFQLQAQMVPQESMASLQVRMAQPARRAPMQRRRS